MKEKWIQNARLHKGALHHQLGIPEHENIPKGLLNEIRTAPVGGHVQGPHGSLPVTGLLKKRVNLAIRLRRM